jgi:formylglycine-generating enzyme required for sulfatase activity
MTSLARTIEALLLSTSFVALCGQAMADAPEALTPAQPFVNSLGVRMVWIPPGTYQMGSPGGEAGRNKNEGPVHKVTFVKGFWMSECEITQEQWQRLMATNPSFFKGPKRPVANVNLMDCHEFCTLLSAREGRDYRLPTESEWEYACRAGSHESRYQKLDDIAWYAANSGRTTHDVGTKLPNAWGLYDMLGNVLEWCEDSFHQDYKGAPADGGNNWNDERGPGKDLNPFCQVLRGGSWEDSEANCRAAARFALAFGVTYPGTVIVPDTFGLRLVCTGESKTRASSSSTPRMTPRAASAEEERKAQENKVVFSSLLPVCDNKIDAAGQPIVQTGARPNESIKALNRWIAAYAQTHRHVYLDYFSAMARPDGTLNPDLTNDGLHPNVAGYAVMAPLAEKAITAALTGTH